MVVGLPFLEICEETLAMHEEGVYEIGRGHAFGHNATRRAFGIVHFYSLTRNCLKRSHTSSW
jgi:hypothetical protein